MLCRCVQHEELPPGRLAALVPLIGSRPPVEKDERSSSWGRQRGRRERGRPRSCSPRARHRSRGWRLVILTETPDTAASVTGSLQSSSSARQHTRSSQANVPLDLSEPPAGSGSGGGLMEHRTVGARITRLAATVNALSGSPQQGGQLLKQGHGDWSRPSRRLSSLP